MGKTYRGKDKIRKKFSAFRSDESAVYKNASRTMCSRAGSIKWLFKSEGACRNAIAYNKKSRNNRGKDRYERAYYCPACNGWHITTKTITEWRDKVKKIEKLGIYKNTKKKS